MIPTASPTYLHNVYGELFETGRKQDQLLCGTGRSRDRSKVIAEHPGHQSELFFTADGTHHRTLLPMKFCSSQQVRIGVADLGHSRSPGVHLSEQRPAPKRIVHHLSLQSHADQSTSLVRRPAADRHHERLQFHVVHLHPPGGLDSTTLTITS